MKRLLAIVLGVITMGCANAPTTVKRAVAKPELVVGVWRSVTPSYEFVRLAVYTTSSRADVLAARLTLSGSIWDGSGRIDADSVVAAMNLSGQSVATGAMTLRGRDGQTLDAQLRPLGGAPVSLSFVRE